jgi:hypothetical protein
MFTDGWSFVIESPHEPGSGAAPAGAVRCERGDRRKAGAVPRICRADSPESAREGSAGERWVHEIKSDGYRIQAHLQAGRPAIMIVETPALPPNL